MPFRQLRAGVERFFGSFGPIVATETGLMGECAIYRSLPEIVESNAIFLVVYAEKSHANGIFLR